MNKEDKEKAAFKEAIRKHIGDKVDSLTDENIENMLKSYYKSHTPWKRTNKQGRNELCQCGSGKKFKNCCNKRAEYALKTKKDA